MGAEMLKKILAAMLVASSVMSMSGTVLAAKKAPRNEKSQGASKDPAGKKTKRKRRKFVKIKKNLKSSERGWIRVDLPFENPPTPIYIPRYYMPVPSVKTDIYNGDGDSMMKSLVPSDDTLSEEDDRCVVHITHQIRSFKLNGNLRNLKKCSMEKRVRLANALVNWIKSKRVARNIDAMVAIVDLAENEFFDGFDQAQKLDIVRTLVNFFEGSCLCKSDCVWAFRHLVKAGFLNGNEASEEVLQLQKILNDFEKIDANEPDIGLDYGFCDNNDDYDDLEF